MRKPIDILALFIIWFFSIYGMGVFARVFYEIAKLGWGLLG